MHGFARDVLTGAPPPPAVRHAWTPRMPALAAGTGSARYSASAADILIEIDKAEAEASRNAWPSSTTRPSIRREGRAPAERQDPRGGARRGSLQLRAWAERSWTSNTVKARSRSSFECDYNCTQADHDLLMTGSRRSARTSSALEIDEPMGLRHHKGNLQHKRDAGYLDGERLQRAGRRSATATAASVMGRDPGCRGRFGATTIDLHAYRRQQPRCPSATTKATSMTQPNGYALARADDSLGAATRWCSSEVIENARQASGDRAEPNRASATPSASATASTSNARHRLETIA